jgi:outer membrane protein assembly factor BamB
MRLPPFLPALAAVPAMAMAALLLAGGRPAAVAAVVAAAETPARVAPAAAAPSGSAPAAAPPSGIAPSGAAPAGVPPGSAPFEASGLFRGGRELQGRAEGSLPRDLAPAWTFRAGAGISSTAAIWHGTVYVGSQDGYLYGLALDSGAVRLKIHAEGPIRSSPVVRDGTLYFGDGAGVFTAADAATGRRLWSYRSGAEIVSAANFTRRGVIFGSYDQGVHCLDPFAGTVRWNFETEGYVNATPAVVADLVVVAGCDGYLRCLSDRGVEIWKVNLGGYVGASPVVWRGKVFVGTFENQVVAVGLLSGKVLWRYQDPARQFPFYSSAAVRDDLLVVGGRDKRLHALAPDTGKPLWSYGAKGAVDSSPVLVGDRVVAASRGGDVFALDDRTGEARWQFAAGAPIEASPAVAGGRLIIGTLDGTLYCFAAKS